MMHRWIRGLSVGRRIAGGFLISVALLALSIPFVMKDHLLLYDRVQRVTNVDSRADRLLLLSSKRIESSRVNLMRYIEDLVPSHQESLNDISQAALFLAEAQKLMEAHEQQSAVAGVIKALGAYESLIREVGATDKKEKNSETRRREFMTLKTGNDIGLQIESIVEKSEDHIAEENKIANARAKKSLNFLVAGYAGVVLLSLLIAGLLGRSITKPIAELRVGAESFRQGKTDIVLPVEGSDELSLLARTFNQMGAELHESKIELQERALALERELTERERMEQAIRESEERFRSLFDGVPVGLYRSSPQGQIIAANLAMVNMLGYPDRETLLTANASVFYVDPRDRLHWEEQVGCGALVGDFEFQARRYDGTVIWIEDSARVMKNEEGDVLYFEGSLAEITQRKRAEEELQRYQAHLQELVEERTGELTQAVQRLSEEIAERRQVELALRESQQRMLLLVQSSPLAVIEWDPDFRVVAWNPAAERIFGYQGDEAMGRHATEIIVPEEVHEQVDQIWQTLIEKKGGTRSTNVNITKERKRITCAWYNSPLIDDTGRAVGVASLVDDITARKKMEEELTQKLKDLERFNRLVVGREGKMIQLKKEINELREQSGLGAKYNLAE